MKEKSTPNQMRILLRRMRGEKTATLLESKEQKKEMTVRDMLKITRNLNEQEEPAIKKNFKTNYDQRSEEEKFRNYFDDLNVTIDFIPLEVYENLVFWGGTIDGEIQFVYKVTPDEKSSGVELNNSEDLSWDIPENSAIKKRILSYYDSFFKYWRDNILQK